MKFNKLLEKQVSGKIAIIFGLLALLELVIVFTDWLYSSLRYYDSFRLAIMSFEFIATPITVFILGSYSLQKIGKLSLKAFRLGYIFALIYGATILLILYSSFILRHDTPFIWLASIPFDILFEPIIDLTESLIGARWGMDGFFIAVDFAYIVAGPLMIGFLISLIHFGINRLKQKGK